MFGVREKVQTEYKKNRSSFWLRITENSDGSYNFDAKSHLVSCINFHFPKLEKISPKGWTKNRLYDYSSLWIPASHTDEVNLSDIKRWAEFAGKGCVWIIPSSEMLKYFSPDTIKYCIAGDFNFDKDEDSRTPLGKAENLVKYGHLTNEDKKTYMEILSNSIVNIAKLLPIRPTVFFRLRPLIISTIPTEENKLNNFLEELTQNVCCAFDYAETIAPTLKISKPQMKSLSLVEKINAWKEIYSTADNIDLDLSSIKDATVVIVDDLYQSGTTMLAYAEFLKKHGAHEIYGLSCVKALRNSDNKTRGGAL